MRLFRIPVFAIPIILFNLLAGEPEFRFAWLSDLHIGSSTASEDLRRVVNDININEPTDFVIVSGDITELDIGGSLDTAKFILDELQVPYYIIPGNHDTKWSASGTRKFNTLWGDDKFNFEFGGYRFIGLHQGPLLRMGDGFIAPEDLTWLDSVLVNLPDPAQRLILVTHYPMTPAVSNWYEYLDIVRDYNVQMIIHGHHHTNKVDEYESIPGILGRSTLRRNDAVGGYNLVSVWPDSAVFRERVPAVETKSPWHTQTLGSNVFPEEVYDRPDFTSNDDFPAVNTRWVYDTGYAVAASPLVIGDRVYIADGSGAVRALDYESGKLLWTRMLPAPIYSTPAGNEKYLVVSATDSNIYCISADDGSDTWRLKTGAPLVASPVIHDGNVYCGASDGVFRAIGLESGKLHWQYSGVKGFVESAPLIHRGKIIFGAWDGSLYALDAKSGSLEWRWQDGRPGILYSPAACIPVASGNKIYIVAPDRVMSCINARSGKTIWREDRYMVRESIGISPDRKTVFAKTMRDTVVAIHAGKRKPRLKYAVHAGYGYDIDACPPVQSGNTLFLGTKDGFVYSLAAETGEVNWFYRVGVGLLNNLTPLNDKSVIVSSMDGLITRVDVK